MIIQHVHPVEDISEHDLACTNPIGNRNHHCPCRCHPEYKYLDNCNLLVIHNSFDGREGLEWANVILNNTQTP